MNDKKTFIVQDENGIQSIAEILTILMIDGIKYVVYTINNTEENKDVYASRVIKKQDGTDTIVSIDDEEEKKNIFSIIEKIINKD